MRPQFSETAWGEYTYWQTQDKKTLKKINNLIKDILRNGVASGEGKPEPLSGNLSGCYSRRINDKDRLVYHQLDNDVIEILSCRGHYEEH